LTKTGIVKRVIIIGDDDVAYRIMQEVIALGATGYTHQTVHGKGSHGFRPTHGEPANAKIEIIAAPEIAYRILEHIDTRYCNKYAMIVFIDDVEVLRPEKFGAAPIDQP
jgi:hypothetical protein